MPKSGLGENSTGRLQISGISKRFGSIRANDDVSLTVEPGTLHAILGENGAGKSTLMKILSGFQAPDQGTVTLGGIPLELGSSRRAIATGIGMLHQDPLVVLPFTVLENFILGSDDRRNAKKRLAEISSRLGFNLEPGRITRSLSVGERQQLEIVRLLAQGVKVLILDEPTSGISAIQRDSLFGALKALAAEGLIVLFVSHKLEEVEELCTSVTVMRQGRVVGTEALPVPPSQLVAMMFGEAGPVVRPAPHSIGGPLLSIKGLSTRDGNISIADIYLEVAEGEVLGLAGLEGSGQRVLLRVLAGLVKASKGSVRLGELELAKAGQRRHLNAGIHLMPAGRLEEGLFPGLTIAEHMALATRKPVSKDVAETAIERFRIKGLPGSVVDALSGGNQQRLQLAMIPDYTRLLLLEQPTRGLDIESAGTVWGTILDRRTRGTSIVFASSDLDELAQYSDRIAVFFEGRLLDVVTAAEADPARLGLLIGGVT